MKRIGMLIPSSSVFSEQEKQKILPKGVLLLTTRIRMKRPTYEEILRMADYVEEAASLLADAEVDIIAFSCTVGSLIKGKGYDQEIIDRIGRATGLPATTSTTAVVAGLKALGAERLVVITPYVERIKEMETAFLEDAGFQVLSSFGLGLDVARDQYQVEPSRWYKLVKQMQDPRADSYLISCGGIRVVDIIGQTESEVRRPVVTSNQALVWHCLRKIGVEEPIEGFGCLLKTNL